MASYISDSEDGLTSSDSSDEKFPIYIIVWLDPSITEPPSQELQELTQQLSMQWKFFSALSEATDSITSCPPGTFVILISSGSLGRQILRTIHSSVQLEATIIYCLDLDRNLQWTKNYSKVLCVVNEPTQLQYELAKFLAKHYKRLGESVVASGDRTRRETAQMNFTKAMDILRQFARPQDKEVSLLMHELELKGFKEQTRKKRLVELEKMKGNKEDITLVWLDQKIDDRGEHVQNLLKKLSDNVQMYSTHQQCLQDLTDRDDKVFLIISGTMAELYFNDYHQLSQVDSIFIFCIQRQKYLQLFSVHKKFVGCFTREQDLIEAVHRLSQLKTYANFSLLDVSEPTPQRLTKQSAVFLWNHLLSTVLSEMKTQPVVTKMKLLRICRDYYCGNKAELHNISSFDDTYDEAKAIVWYTKDSFVHKLLNKALRTHDHEKLLAFRCYTQDLLRQLYEAHGFMRKKAAKKVLTVYRGQMMHRREVEELKTNVNNLISMNGFLSTTLSRQVALMYTEQGITHTSMPNYQSCLFEIEVDLRQSSIIFADISEWSDYPDEQEVLFTIGTIFRVHSISHDEDESMWIIKLRDAPETSEYVNNYFQLAKTELNESNNILLFAKLMYSLGEYSKFDVYFKQLSNTLPEQQDNIMQLLFKTALACEKKGKMADALNNYTQLLDSQLNTPAIGSTLCSIAQLYSEQENYSLALANYGKALEIQSKCLPIQHPVLMQTLKEIGKIRATLDCNGTPAAKRKRDDSCSSFETSTPSAYSSFMSTDSDTSELEKSMVSDEEAELAMPLIFYLTATDATNEIQQQFTTTKQIVHNNCAECLAEIRSMTGATIFFVVLSSSFDEAILDTLEQLPQVHSVYLSTFIAAENLKEIFSKVRFVCSHNDNQLLVNRLKKDLAKHYRLKGDQYGLGDNLPLAQFCQRKALNYF